MVNSDYHLIFGNPDPMRQNTNSFEAENAKQNLYLLVKLVIEVNELIYRQHSDKKSSMVLQKLFVIIFNAWEEQTYKLSNALWNTFRHCGGMDSLTNNCGSEYEIEQFSNARFLGKCLTETSDYVLKNVEDKVLRIVCKYKTQVSSVDGLKFNFRIFENVFKHCEITFIDLNKIDGLGVLLDEWRRQEVLTLKQSLNVLFNLWRLYECPKNQNIMIKHNVHARFFTLMFNTEDNVKYYIAILVIDNEVRTAIIKSKIPTLIPISNLVNFCGQNQMCLEKRTPVLNSDSEKTSNASKVRIKKQLRKKSMFRAINVIKPLEKVAIFSNDTTSRLTDQSCQLIVEEVPYRPNTSVHQWSAEDVCKWFKKNGFSELANNLLENRVDGDLLLRFTEDELKNEIGIHNGIMKNRFIRELNNLKQSADYSSIDTTDLNSFLKSISSEYSVYTYPMLNAGVKRDSMRLLTDEQLKNDCGISNGVHRSCILASIKEMPVYVENTDKPYDVFISYKRSTDSLLASLLKVYLKIRGYNVFLDVKRSDDAKSRHHVLQTIRQTKNFIIVLTPGSLEKNLMDSSAGDIETLEFICEEVMTAEQTQCNIIPVLDNSFTWPPPALLPDDLKNLCNYNSINWVHEYQEACVKKLVTFMNQF
ncbi:sterile alpha and TIR motif-containing protein 1-like [Acyrthosiphon pisum]|uniref:ADP-ribosyl cyclase/cyclic ADP-ribose hydrolase n=1 Tax=Acyrthosiphon pisum TaxID=7029 RepID=A0A8R2A883_ACYPI|nr:sterile alpha and TIR motif-containing protein 1-like [Acyrthosiphon pisum]|eukprot:XP_001949141.1 PREDICTED: sterile alpha and TIR motif-containing protein 1-like [Acyrthosiphon pisum]